MSSADREYFAFFGLPPNLTVDLDDLKARFYKLSREWHPDKFSRAPIEDQQRALDATAVINDGYRVLRDPIRRAEYVLSRNGFEIGEQKSKDVPPELLEEVFDLNMALEELRSGDEDARPQLESAKMKFVAMREEIDANLSGLFTKYDAAKDAAVLAEIRGALNRRRYIENLVRDVEKALAA
ncbi:MAG: Fe-S protein assembly co-chaperone HscB [Bryobacteraceae bacterium]